MTTATAAAAPAEVPEAPPQMTSWPYRFEVLSLDRLFVDDSYQRDLTSFAQRIIRDFDPALVGCLVIADRSTSTDADLRVKANARNRYATIDGQTRAHAMRELEMTDAPCVVFEGLSRAAEASLFARLQTQRRGMATYMRFRAALVSEDPEAIAIEAIARRHGYEIGTGSTIGKISAISAMEYAYRRELLDAVLGTIRSAWPDREDGDVSGDMIRGLATFYRRTKNVDQNRLEDRLAMVTPAMLKHRASALREGGGASGNAPGYMADAILGEYMRRERKR